MKPDPFDAGVQLHLYRGQADILLTCVECIWRETVPLEATIERLNARGLDGEGMGIRELARHVRKACPQCGKRAWETRPAFHGVPGQKGTRG